MLTWQQLVRMSGEELAKRDIGLVNLACAVDLPGGDIRLDIDHCLRTLDHWANYIRQRTPLAWPKFQENPQHWDGSWNSWRSRAESRVSRRARC